MLEFAGMNYWAVLVVWLLYMVVGSLWYSPIMFAKKWQEHTGIDMLKIPQNEATHTIIFVALSAGVQALTLGVLFNSLKVTDVTNGLVVALTLWFGLVAATTVGTTLYARRSWKFLWLNSSYFLLVMVAGALIFSTWR